MDFFAIPIFIISYNRLFDLQKCITRLESDGYKNLIIVDNASTDEPLLDYLHTIPYKVHFLDKNWGPYVVWKSHLFDDVILNQYYVVTDPDIIPIENCPSDYLECFYEILQEFPSKTKVGFSLKLDDIPDEYQYKYDIWRFESFYWEKIIKTKKCIAYDAPLDTTFALYRPVPILSIDGIFMNAIRVGGNYQARHLGWYITELSLEKYGEYYLKSTNGSTSFNNLAMQKARLEFFANFVSNFDLDICNVTKSMSRRNILRKTLFYRLFGTFIFVLLKKLQLVF